ncbi:hypothetical protein EDEG_01635 [Edhazardia aedis USNM 41457]|uniref:Uncharacterized protein n=1 Tax=Edhazardia aedis (strain USNM 41457) TaxID=1003232 RepID=J9D9A9_EDHAE|nr:hypothetical protein EDEG_01635 [Edhazardia aedis USNM 41457]|eukprot:EJW04059.1 hypothetical protein EDEG_01635 [Edhazardia aedis USNM 41457]
MEPKIKHVALIALVLCSIGASGYFIYYKFNNPSSSREKKGKKSKTHKKGLCLREKVEKIKLTGNVNMNDIAIEKTANKVKRNSGKENDEGFSEEIEENDVEEVFRIINEAKKSNESSDDTIKNDQNSIEEENGIFSEQIVNKKIKTYGENDINQEKDEIQKNQQNQFKMGDEVFDSLKNYEVKLDEIQEAKTLLRIVEKCENSILDNIKSGIDEFSTIDFDKKFYI